LKALSPRIQHKACLFAGFDPGYHWFRIDSDARFLVSYLHRLELKTAATRLITQY
jgi:hypothetical protein